MEAKFYFHLCYFQCNHEKHLSLRSVKEECLQVLAGVLHHVLDLTLPLSVNHRCKTDHLPRNMCCQCQFETLHRFLPLLVTSTLKLVNHKHICNIYQSQAVWERRKPLDFNFAWLCLFGLTFLVLKWFSIFEFLS